MSDKTEDPTPKRLRESRQKGQVAQSKDVVSTALLVALFGYLVAMSGSISGKLQEMIRLPASFYQAGFADNLGRTLGGVAGTAAAIVLPILVITIVTAIAASFFQFGLLFSFEAAKPSAKKLNVGANLKNMFSLKNLVEFLKSILKVVVLTAVIYFLIRDSLDLLVRAPRYGLPGVGALFEQLVIRILAFTMLVYAVVAAFDYFFQKRMHLQQLRMSKDEVKREYREMEGDPQIKGMRRQLHHQMVMSDSIERTRKATVVITNPTHYAIALLYEAEETALPVVLAKGQDLMAKRMIEVAQEEDIPIMENVPLAHALMDQADVNHFIPSELIDPVAQVLRWVQELGQAQS